MGYQRHLLKVLQEEGVKKNGGKPVKSEWKGGGGGGASRSHWLRGGDLGGGGHKRTRRKKRSSWAETGRLGGGTEKHMFGKLVKKNEGEEGEVTGFTTKNRKIWQGCRKKKTATMGGRKTLRSLKGSEYPQKFLENKKGRQIV